MNINYPNGTHKNNSLKRVKTFANRGMNLEEDLNITNEYYLEKNIAVIHKKPTPIQVIKTSLNKITLAYFKEPSTTDYNGLYKGNYIDFEAKETTYKTSFPLENIHTHQIKHIRKILEHNGICFIIVRFNKLNITYLLFAQDFIWFIDNNKRKSIPISYFEEKGYKIKLNLNPRLDYLKIIDEFGGIYENKEKRKK